MLLEKSSPNTYTKLIKEYGSLLTMCAALLMLAASVPHSEGFSDRNEDKTHHLEIAILSGRPDRVSGGDVLVQITVPQGARRNSLMATLNGRDVTSSFRSSAPPASFIGLIAGLRVGKNELSVQDARDDQASITLTNYPIQGPIVSGPHIHPFVCGTAKFFLPDGSTLGPSLDSDCTAATKINYIYMSTSNKRFKILPNIFRVPVDVAKTTTNTGATVNFVVRVEATTINRGIYVSAILHDPTVDPPISALSQPKGWNGILIGVHGGGCAGGWYAPPAATSNSPTRGRVKLLHLTAADGG